MRISKKISDTYNAYVEGTLEDVKGFCAVVDTEKIAEQDYILTPGRYVGVEEQEDDGEPFEEKMARLTSELRIYSSSHISWKQKLRRSWGRLGMKSEWTYRPLGELVSFASGGTPSKKRDDYWGGTIPWISAKTLKTENIDTSDLFITEEGLKAGSKIAPKGSILLLTRGSGLFNGIPIARVEKDVAFNQDIKCLDSYGEVENEFIFYWLLSQKDYLMAKVGDYRNWSGKI